MTKKAKLVLLLAVVVSASTVVGVYALLNSKSDVVANQFSGTAVNIAVIENGKDHEDATNNTEEYKELKQANDSVVKEVAIKNKNAGNTSSVYVRVKLVPSYRSSTDLTAVHGKTPNITYDLQENTDWKMNADGTFYYTKGLGTDETSALLLKHVTLNESVPEGYYLELKVISDAIVTRPSSVLSDAWGMKDFSGLTALPAQIEIK